MGQTPQGHGYGLLTTTHVCTAPDTTHGTAVYKQACVRGGLGRQANACVSDCRLDAHRHSQRELAKAERVDRGAVARGAVERGAIERGDDARDADARGACR